MELGLLPALGSGIGELRRTGQASRFIDGYLRPYARAFGRVWYFSYLPETPSSAPRWVSSLPARAAPASRERSRCPSPIAASSGGRPCSACSR